MAFSRILFNSLVVIGFTIIISSCKGKDKEKTIDAYPEYKIIATEGDDNLAVIAQLKPGDEFGDAISLTPPSAFLLDGEPLVADTAKFGGFFYELYKPIDKFSGKHTLTYRSEDGTVSNEEFLFEPLTLTTVLPETFSRKDMELELTGALNKEVIRIVMVDTSFGSEGLNYTDTVQNGKLLITAWKLGNLVDGPVQLELMREYERSLEHSGYWGGKMTVDYTIRREFTLKSD